MGLVNECHKKNDEYKYDKDTLENLYLIFEQVLKNYSEEQQAVGKFLFEREYNLFLTTAIVALSNAVPNLENNKLREFFGFFGLLPNVHSRYKYISMIGEYLIKNSSVENARYINSKKTEDWYEEAREVMLEFALISLPVMEVCYYELLHQCSIIPLEGKTLNESVLIAKDMDVDKETFSETAQAVERYKTIIESKEYSLEKFIEDYKEAEIGDIGVLSNSSELELLNDKILELPRNIFEFVGKAHHDLFKRN